MTEQEKQARKVQIYYKLKRLISLKRKQVSEQSLPRFIDLYLPHHATKARPAFHNAMLALMEAMVLSNATNTTSTQPRAKQSDKTIEEEGGIAPTSPVLLNRGVPTQFSSKNTKSLLTKEENSVPYFFSGENPLTRILFIAPRGFAKSTLCSVFFPLWLACFKKKADIFIVSATMSLAKEQLRKIRIELENNEKLKEDFGELMSDKWTEEMLVLSNNVILRAKGREFQIRGFRPDFIICDDLEDEEAVNSREQRDKIEYWFFRTLLPALKPDQGLLYVGTKLSQFSLISKLEQKEEFTVRSWKALENEKSIWEELWPTETLFKLRKEIGSYAFEAEYQNNPISLKDQPIKPEYLNGVRIEGKVIASCLAIDPAISEKESSDYRAFTLFERTEEGFREIYSEHGRWGIDEQMDKIISIYKDFKPTRVVIEEVAFQKVYRDVLTKKAREQGIFIPVSTAMLGTAKDKRPRDKVTRLMGVSHLFEQRLVEIRNPDLYQELVSFPHGDYDDMADATVYALQWLLDTRFGKVSSYLKENRNPVKATPSFYVEEVRPGVYVAKAGEVLASNIMKPSLKVINYDRRG